METLWLDIRFAFRTLRNNLSVTVLATASLALAIAGNTAVYSLVNSFLYRPIPYQDVERLVLVGEYNDELLRGQLSTTSAANFLDFSERQLGESFESLAAIQGGVYTLGTDSEEAEQLTVGLVTPGFFPMVGADLREGRSFHSMEGVRGHDRVVILSHDFRAEKFPDLDEVSGLTLELNGEIHDVIGTIGEDFEWLLAPNTDIWVPLVLERDAAPRQRRNLFAIARLADGVSEEAAQAQSDAVMAQLVDEYPDINRGFGVELLNLRHDIPDSRNRLFFQLIQVALLFVLMIACVNIANLLLSRSQARERELAIRGAIGASRRRIIMQLFTESTVMAMIAGIVGVGLGFGGMKMINSAFAAVLPTFWLPTLDLRVLGYTLLVTLFGAVLFGLAPVLQFARFDLQSALKDGSKGASSGNKRRLASNALVTLEISFALAFLAGASMMINSFETMQTVDPGFETNDKLIMRIDLPDSRYSTGEQLASGAREVRRRLEALPGVSSATVSNFSPRTPFVPRDSFSIEGQNLAEDQAPPQASWIAVDDGFFETLDVTMVRGRTFRASDDVGSVNVAIVNQSMAERFWNTDDPIGQQLTIQGERREIVGVVSTVHHSVIINSGSSDVVYLPWSQQPNNAFGVTLATDVEASTLTEAVRREVTAFDRSTAVTQIQTLDSFVEQFWVGQKVFTAILGGFGTLALILAALGTYGVLAYSVAQRTYEIGIRMAIGADRGAVLRMIVRQGLIVGSIGIGLGMLLVPVQVRLISSVFQGFVPVEPSSVIGAALVLLLVTIAASTLPARRAASIEPITALRSE